MFNVLLSIAFNLLAIVYCLAVLFVFPYLLFRCLFRITANLEQIVAYCEWHARVEQMRFEKQFPEAANKKGG